MEQVEEKERFTVKDAFGAEWAMEKIAEKQAEIAEMARQRDKMIARYNEWYAAGTEALNGDIAYFEKLLADWAREELAEGKAKSISLPSGRIGFRAAPATVTFVGTPVDKTNADFIAMVKKSAPEYVETKESVKWGDLKKTLTFADGGKVISADGEVLAEMAWTQPEPTFYANVKGGE